MELAVRLIFLLMVLQIELIFSGSCNIGVPSGFRGGIRFLVALGMGLLRSFERGVADDGRWNARRDPSLRSRMTQRP